MPRIARIMFEGIPFHVTHRGNQKRQVFERDWERRRYLRILQGYAERFGMRIWGYCLMPNHVHLIVVGRSRLSIARAIGNTHRDFSRTKNLATAVTGHWWANRFYSTALDEPHLWAAIRYVERNPVRAGLVATATDYPWSSARTHADSRPSSLLDPQRPFPGPIADWRAWLAVGIEDEVIDRLRRNTSTGHPSGNREFEERVEARLGRPLAPRRGSRR